MNLLIGALIALLIFLNEAHGVSVSAFSSMEQKQKVFSLIDNDYEDTRIDYDYDKKIDYWRIKKGSLWIEVYYTPVRTIYHVRSFNKTQVDERIFFSENSKLYLAFTKQRKQFIYNFTSQGPLCIENHKNEWAKLTETFAKLSTQSIAMAAESFVGTQCGDILKEETYEHLLGATQEIFNPPGKTENTFIACLESPSAKGYFVKKFGEKDGALNYEKAIVGFKNSIVKFSELPKTDSSILTCKIVEGDLPKNPMKVTETGAQILLQIKKDQSISSAEFKEQLFHESLHISSITDEDLNADITNLCLGKKKIENKDVNKQDWKKQLTKIDPSEMESLSMGSATTKLDVLKGKDLAAKNHSLDIKDAAEASSLPGKHQSPVEMNRMAEAAGATTIAEASKVQTSGVIKAAESVLGSTLAVAAEPSTSLAGSSGATTGSGSSLSGSSSGSNPYASSPSYSASTSSSSDDSRPSRRASDSSRSPASEYQLDMSIVGAKAPIVKIPTPANSNSVGKGEYIKEEVDLTRSTVTTNSNIGRAPASTKTGSSDASTSSTAQTNNVEQTSGNSENHSTTNGGVSSASFGSDSQSSNGSTSNSTQRRGTSPQTTGGPYVPSRDEVVSFFSGGSYQQARGKLKDQSFVQALKQNNITVYDLGGNTYGASRGEVIFVDQGDRFVRQK